MARIVHLMQCSTQFSDQGRLFVSDLEEVYSRNAHVIGFTELGNPDRERIWRAETKRHGYYPVKSPEASTGLAIRQNRNCKLLSTSTIFVHGGLTSKYGPRYVTTANVKFHEHTLWIAEAHWVPGLFQSQTRMVHHREMTRVVLEAANINSRGTRKAFVLGDVNENDDANNDSYPDDMFYKAGLWTVYDELNRYPATAGNKTIDIVARMNKDRGVKADRMKVWPALNMDHQQVSVWYRLGD